MRSQCSEPTSVESRRKRGLLRMQGKIVNICSCICTKKGSEKTLSFEKINVELYGGKSIFSRKETPLEADEIYCDRANQCTFYAENTCLRCRSPFAPSCKFGETKCTNGYTSRARKYYSFKSKYENDEM